MTAGIADGLETVARRLRSGGEGVALTGAGISVDSGIPDFRSAGGLWDEFDPMEYATITAFQRDPEKVWRMLHRLDGIVREARPNPGHEALARLERLGLLRGVITQNVDNLHQAAGSRRVVEFHGNGSRLRCLRCEQVYDAAASDDSGRPPRCACGQVLKPDVVFFGEQIPQPALQGAHELVRGCRVMLVVGTSATVAPASAIPHLARREGAMLVEVNLETTELSAHCDVTLQGSASEVLPLLAERAAAGH